MLFLVAGLAAALPVLAERPTAGSELATTWRGYCMEFIQSDGRVLDRSEGDRSTSEGQAYAMARAVWMDDQETFQRVRDWTRDNLQGGEPTRLPAWNWGRSESGAWEVLDTNPASDADIWMAFALLMAAERWDASHYAEQAIGLLEQIWNQETLLVGPRRFLLPGPWAIHESPLRLNPSYVFPSAFRLFAAADPAHAWNTLLDDSYWLLEVTRRSDGLPPDWVWFDLEVMQFASAPEGQEQGTAFGYEALRIPWVLAADTIWYGDPRAAALLWGMTGLVTRWREEGSLPAVILKDGSAGRPYAFLGMYGALLPAWKLTHPEDAQRLVEDVIQAARTSGGWGSERDYYGQNWVWFGLALESGLAGRPG